jgi:ADP-ribose pyrophosphatase YjhB (NUDIX family)
MAPGQSNWSEHHHRAPRMSVAVGAMVVYHESILFVQNTYGPFKQQWSIPTGFVDPGECPEAAALREVREEAGITAALDGLLAVSMIDWEGDPQVYMVFLCHHVSGKPVPDGTENSHAAYLTLEQIETSEIPVETQNLWLVRQVLNGKHTLLRPVEIISDYVTYLTTFG